MEEQYDRVLAYALARPVAGEDLESISGGGRPAGQMCSRETLKASGSDLRAVDVAIDMTIDW